MDRSTLEKKQLVELREIASTLELSGYTRMRKADLVDLIIGADGPGANGNGTPDAGADASDADEATDPDSQDGGQARDAGPDAGTDSEQAADEPASDEDPSAKGSDDQESGDGDRATKDNGSDGTDRPDDAAKSGDGVQDADDDADGEGQDGKHRAKDHRAVSGGARPRSRRRDDSSGSGSRSSDKSRGQTASKSGSARTDSRQSKANDGKPDHGDNKGGGNMGGGRNQKQDQKQGQKQDQNRRRKGRSNKSDNKQNHDDSEVREGVLDLLPEGYGFLRTTSYLTGDKDVYVSQNYVRRFNLRRGDRVAGPIRHNKRGSDKFPALARVDTIEGLTVDEHKQLNLPRFKDLTPLFPNERLRLETEEKAPVAMRIMDLMSPIGKGQRGLIVSPPKAGKTTILKQLAHSIEANNPEVHVMVLLVDERPEEVTDFERSVKGEVISSTFDRPADDHTQAAELASERAQRLVERGHDVVILLDSITRLGRAYNLAAPASGRILSGGIDSAALYPPKRFFGAARNIEDGGSLTILASALIETGSKMDEVIFEEFKGTGNMELRLDRRMEQKRIFPAIDVAASGTRREELLLGKSELEIVWRLRRVLAQMDTGAALELLIDKLNATRSNKQFLQAIAKSNIA